MNVEFGGTVMKKDTREDGQFQIPVETSSPLFRFVCSLPFLIMFTSVENVCLYNIGAFLLNLPSSSVAISSHRLQFISLACIQSRSKSLQPSTPPKSPKNDG